MPAGPHSLRASDEPKQASGVGWGGLVLLAGIYLLIAIVVADWSADSMFGYCDENRRPGTARDNGCNTLEDGGYELMRIIPPVAVGLAAALALWRRRAVALHVGLSLALLLALWLPVFASQILPGR